MEPSLRLLAIILSRVLKSADPWNIPTCKSDLRREEDRFREFVVRCDSLEEGKADLSPQI